jgi:hypothetical protein
MNHHKNLLFFLTICLALVTESGFGMRTHQGFVAAMPAQEIGKSEAIAKNDPLSAYPFNQAQKKAIQLLLSRAKGWRIALPTDNHSPDLQQYQKEHPGFTPYYVEGDLTGHGKRDFVIALVQGEHFAVVFFEAEGDHYLSPQWLTRHGALSDGGLFIDRRGLFVGGPFYSDNLVLFVWSEKAKRLVQQ